MFIQHFTEKKTQDVKSLNGNIRGNTILAGTFNIIMYSITKIFYIYIFFYNQCNIFINNSADTGGKNILQ